MEKRLDAELRFHLEQRVRDYEASGLSPKEARRRANLAFGGLEQVKEDCREARKESHVEAFLRDFHYAWRSLVKNRRLALVAVFALALGIGAATVMFSVVYNVVFDPFPYRDFQHSIVFEVKDLNAPKEAPNRDHYTVPEFLAIREQNKVFEDLIGNYQLDVLYTDSKGTRRFSGGFVTTNGFDFLGVPPLLGRVFSPQDGESGAPPVFVMNYRLWQTEFAGDPKLLGTTFFLNGKARTLIGIMPERFNGYDAGLWLPLGLYQGAEGISFVVKDPAAIWMLGRLRKGVSLEAAAADLDAILHRFAQANRDQRYPKQFRVETRTLLDFVVGRLKNTLYVLVAAVFLLLLIACSNVMNLLLLRATAREREMALRASLGSSRGRLLRYLLAESLILATGACLAGCLLAYLGLKALVAIIPRGPIPEETAISLNPAALLFALGIAVLVSVVCGLAPALHVVRGDLLLRMTGGTKGGGFRYGKVRSGLVVAEVALSIILLTGTGLMIRNFFALTHVELSFDPATTLYVRVAPAIRAGKAAASDNGPFFEKALERVRNLPGVASATLAIGFPPLGGAGTYITIRGDTGSKKRESMLELCSASYFQTLGLRLVDGRLFSANETNAAPRVVVVNQAFVRAHLEGQPAIGRGIKFDVLDELPGTPRDAYFEIVGVVSDSKNGGLFDAPMPEAFLPYTIYTLGERVILAKTTVDPKSLLTSVQREIWSVDSNAAVARSGSVKDLVAESAYTQPRFGMFTISAFAGIGLALVLIGIFSVTAYSVALRTNEIGVRVALGARRADILAMVLWQGLRLISSGILLGVLASLGVVRFLAGQVSGVSVTDPLTFSAVVTAFLVISLIACLLPARRAANADPMVALRYE
jgi:putative ABC transport system permease protein